MYEFILHYQLRSLQKENNFSQFKYNYLTKLKGLKSAKLFAAALLADYKKRSSDVIPYKVEYRNIKTGKSRFVFWE